MEYIRCPRCKNDVPITYLFCPYCGYDLRFILREKLISKLTFKDRIFRLYFLLRNPLITIKHIASAPDLLGSFLASLLASALLFIKIVGVSLKYGVGITFNAIVYLFLLAFLLQFTLWLSLALIINIGIKIVGGRGLFRDLLGLIGYTQIYIGIGHIASFIVVIGAPTSNEINTIIQLYSAGFWAYVPFLLASAFFAGYGLSFTHLLKQFTSISTAIGAITIFILFFYVI